MTTLLSTDADFLAAEREITELRAEREALSPSIATLADEERLDKPLSDRMWALYDQITLSPPVSLTSAAIKLRLLADPDLGLALNEGVNDVDSLRQALRLVERVASGDDEILSLFRRWREAVHASNQSSEDDGGGRDEVTWAIERQIFDAPVTCAVDLAVKAYMLAYEVCGDHRLNGVECGLILDDDEGAIVAADGTLRLDLHAAHSAAVAAVHFLPELAPLAAGVVEISTRSKSEGLRTIVEKQP